MPSSRLLALAFKQASGAEWKFIPWKWRLSSAELEDMHISRPRKLPRMELADLLLDEVPARSVPDTLGMFGLSKLLRLHRVADVHLATLKAYEARFLRLASARFEAGSGLRAPNAAECEQADKRFWECVSELRVQGWCLDDALHEHTAVRSELSALLAPRPFVPKAGRALASKGSGLGSGKGRQALAPQGRGQRSCLWPWPWFGCPIIPRPV